MSNELFSPLPLRSGAVLANRIAKAAMEENMAGTGQLPDRQLLALYRHQGEPGTVWTASPAGMPRPECFVMSTTIDRC